MLFKTKVVVQNKGTCDGYTTPQSVKQPKAAGVLCDLGQEPRPGCDYCDQVYEYPGGPLNQCATDVSFSLPLCSACDSLDTQLHKRGTDFGSIKHTLDWQKG